MPDFVKTVFFLTLIALLYACSSEYQPSAQVQALKKQMSGEQAQKYLQQRIWEAKGSQGICGSRGFWYDQNADMTVYKDGISMLAHRRGKVIGKHEKKIGEVVVFERAYYQYDFLFEKITSINVYDDHLLLPTFPECNKKIVEKYLIIDLYADDLSNLKFVVLTEDLDKTMAAISIVMPDKPIRLK